MTARDLSAGPGEATLPGNDRLLRLWLNLDAAGSGALGVLLAAAGATLDDLLGAPTALLVPVGLALLPWAAALWFVASRRSVSRQATRTVIVLNGFWLVASVLAVAAGWFPFTAAGVAFVLAQAAAVALFATGQGVGLRRAGTAAR